MTDKEKELQHKLDLAIATIKMFLMARQPAVFAMAIRQGNSVYKELTKDQIVDTTNAEN